MEKRRCPRCGTEYGSDTVFCIACGCKLETVVPKRPTACPSCAAVLEQNAQFCTNCGKKIDVNRRATVKLAEIASSGFISKKKKIVLIAAAVAVCIAMGVIVGTSWKKAYKDGTDQLQIVAQSTTVDALEEQLLSAQTSFKKAGLYKNSGTISNALENLYDRRYTLAMPSIQAIVNGKKSGVSQQDWYKICLHMVCREEALAAAAEYNDLESYLAACTMAFAVAGEDAMELNALIYDGGTRAISAVGAIKAQKDYATALENVQRIFKACGQNELYKREQAFVNVIDDLSAREYATAASIVEESLSNENGLTEQDWHQVFAKHTEQERLIYVQNNSYENLKMFVSAGRAMGGLIAPNDWKSEGLYSALYSAGIDAIEKLTEDETLYIPLAYDAFFACGDYDAAKDFCRAIEQILDGNHAAAAAIAKEHLAGKSNGLTNTKWQLIFEMWNEQAMASYKAPSEGSTKEIDACLNTGKAEQILTSARNAENSGANCESALTQIEYPYTDINLFKNLCGKSEENDILIVAESTLPSKTSSGNVTEKGIAFNLMQYLDVERYPASLADVKYIIMLEHSYARNGTYQRAGGIDYSPIGIRERVRVRVTNAATGKNVWSSSYVTGEASPWTVYFFGAPSRYYSGGFPDTKKIAELFAQAFEKCK